MTAQKRKARRFQFIQYLNPKNLSTEIDRCGYRFSISAYVKYILAIYAGTAGFAYFFRLKPGYMLAVMLAVTLFLPDIFLITYKEMYEEKKFEDVTAYMEQILYSFKRRAKILTSLDDTLALFAKEEGKMHGVLKSAAKYIQTADAKENLYREAFALIEQEYGCTRLYRVHDFLMKAEEVGGDFADSADILLDDRKRWVDRIYELQREKKNVKIKITIGIGLSFLICGMTIMMLPKEFHIVKQPVSQAATAFVMIVNMLIWYLAQKKLAGSLIHSSDDVDFQELHRPYEYVMHGNLKKEKRKSWLTVLMLSPCIILVYFKIGLTAAGAMALFLLLIGSQPERRYKSSRKRIMKEVQKVFPEWLMSMSLQLQTDNVHVSLAESIPEAPEILKEELTKLLNGIEQEPDSVHPYLSFMDKVYLPDVVSAMKILYSMAEFGAVDIGKQIGSLVQRNTMMQDKAERLRTEDYLAGVSFLILLPMLTGVLKMLADLALVVVYILSIVQNVS